MAFLPPAAGSIGAPLTSNSLLLTSSSTSSSSPSFDVCLSKYGVSERRDDPDPSLLSDPAHVVVARATAGNLYSAHPPNGYHHRHHQQRRIVSYGQNSREPDVVYGVGGPYDDRRWINAADPRPREAVALQSPLYHHPHLTLPAGVRNPLSTEHPGIRHFQDLRHRTLLLDGSGPMAVGNVPLQYPSKDHLDLILTYQGSRRGLLPPPPPTFGNCADFRDPGYQGYLSRGMSIAMPPGNATSRLIGYRPCLSEPIVFPQRDGTLW